jgi:hypothetical protein
MVLFLLCSIVLSYNDQIHMRILRKGVSYVTRKYYERPEFDPVDDRVCIKRNQKHQLQSSVQSKIKASIGCAVEYTDRTYRVRSTYTNIEIAEKAINTLLRLNFTKVKK